MKATNILIVALLGSAMALAPATSYAEAGRNETVEPTDTATQVANPCESKATYPGDIACIMDSFQLSAYKAKLDAEVEKKKMERDEICSSKNANENVIAIATFFVTPCLLSFIIVLLVLRNRQRSRKDQQVTLRMIIEKTPERLTPEVIQSLAELPDKKKDLGSSPTVPYRIIAGGVAAILCAAISGSMGRESIRHMAILFFIAGIFLLLVGVADYMTYKLKKKEEEANKQEKS
jgi:preprotein translocase subunit SecG